MPTDILGFDGKTTVQEWDAVFKVDDVLYLCEAKHNISTVLFTCFRVILCLASHRKQVNNTVERMQEFKGLKMNAQTEFRQMNKLMGVLCGTFFPEDVRKNAHILGFICVYPSGNRYGVNSPPKEFVIER